MGIKLANSYSKGISQDRLKTRILSILEKEEFIMVTQQVTEMNDVDNSDENFDNINGYVLEKSGLDKHLEYSKKRESVSNGKIFTYEKSNRYEK